MIEHPLKALFGGVDNAVALIDSMTGQETTYKEFENRLKRFSTFLTEKSVTPGDVIMLLADNSVDMVVSIFGSICHGCIILPISPAYRNVEVANIKDHSEPKLVIVDRNSDPFPCLKNVQDSFIDDYLDYSPAETLENEKQGGLLIYTSGSSGSPKGVLLSSENIISNAEAAAEVLNIQDNHLSLCLLPLFHTFGIISDVCVTLIKGGTCVISPQCKLENLFKIRTIFSKYQFHSFSAVPVVIQLIMNAKITLPNSFVYCVTGGAPLPESLRVDFNAYSNAKTIPAYGMSEGTCFTTISWKKVKEKSCGLPICNELKIVDDGGSELRAGQVGNIVICGPSVIRGGYYKDKRQAYLEKSDNWLDTGDVGYLDDDGMLFISGRKKNMVIKGGNKIFLEDIDELLQSHKNIEDACSVQFTDRNDEFDEKIASFIVLKDGVVDTWKSELIKYISEVIGSSKLPNRFEVIDNIPRTGSGKVNRPKLKELIL
ncbi:long-chain fatty acid--CoA ligase [Vibrio sp. T187]|uniref:class I adenylate-forming enzyme family protein n=1 Tax=Vibrio TaxID=662 RepID=UPI0010CA1C96|nr:MULTISPECIES: class I adenylate-forming enzyme family protein [Vibrio]MBW3696758.1 long-chain fatty acid--CoA ligase [Vibrio sp. T187]